MKSKQHKNKHEKLLNSRIAILAMGRSLSDYLVESVAGESFDEVWGINSIGGIIKVDRTFMLDPASRYLDTENAGTQTILARKFLLDKEQKNPIYSCELDSRVPSIQEYPIEEVLSEFKISYLNNTVPYAIAYAIYKKVSSISLYGIDYTYANLPSMAESGRGCCEFWLSIAVTKGIKIEVCPNSTLLDNNVPPTEKLYGYHRLDDPYICVPKDDNEYVVTKKSKAELPEPADVTSIEPQLFDRNYSEKSMHIHKKELKNVG